MSCSTMNVFAIQARCTKNRQITVQDLPFDFLDNARFFVNARPRDSWRWQAAAAYADIYSQRTNS